MCAEHAHKTDVLLANANIHFFLSYESVTDLQTTNRTTTWEKWLLFGRIWIEIENASLIPCHFSRPLSLALWKFSRPFKQLEFSYTRHRKSRLEAECCARQLLKIYYWWNERRNGVGKKIVKNRVRVIGIRISSDVIQLLEYHSELQADTCLSLDPMRRRHSRHANRKHKITI